jgi:hypothetical protein
MHIGFAPHVNASGTESQLGPQLSVTTFHMHCPSAQHVEGLANAPQVAVDFGWVPFALQVADVEFQVHPVTLLQLVAFAKEVQFDVVLPGVLLGPPVPWHVWAAVFQVHPVAFPQAVALLNVVQFVSVDELVRPWIVGRPQAMNAATQTNEMLTCMRDINSGVSTRRTHQSPPSLTHVTHLSVGARPTRHHPASTWLSNLLRLKQRHAIRQKTDRIKIRVQRTGMQRST